MSCVSSATKVINAAKNLNLFEISPEIWKEYSNIN